MAALGHLAFGFAAKPLEPKVPLGVLLAATEVLDILWVGFSVSGIDPGVNCASPLSHGLFMAAAWSVMAALIVGLIYRNRRSGMITGLLVFSHWILDLITHPMGAVFGGNPLPPDLPLFFNGSPQVGFGLYNHSYAVAIAADLGLLILGVILYAANIVKKRRAVKNNEPVQNRDLER
jgi:hypothetical protein